jgi:hypothetical protein
MIDQAVANSRAPWFEQPEIIVPLGIALITSIIAPTWMYYLKRRSKD